MKITLTHCPSILTEIYVSPKGLPFGAGIAPSRRHRIMSCYKTRFVFLYVAHGLSSGMCRRRYRNPHRNILPDTPAPVRYSFCISTQAKERMMRYWQRAMVYCARHKGLTQAVYGSRLMRQFAGQFVAADTADAAITRMAAMRRAGVRGSLFYLGEYVEAPAEVKATVFGLLHAIPELAAAGLDVHVSVDPTQIGSLQSWDVCRENAMRLAEAIGQHATGSTSMLMLDMEDSTVTAPTLDLFHHLHGKGLPVAITLQSYLHRSTDDLAAVIATGAPVRLVKGTCAEDASIARTARQ